MGWYAANGEGKVHHRGLKRPNAFGLYDMHGNAWEWCQDVYDLTFYKKPESSGKDPLCSSGSETRVRRGGSCNTKAGSCRSAFRSGRGPLETCGLRPVRALR